MQKIFQQAGIQSDVQGGFSEFQFQCTGIQPDVQGGFSGFMLLLVISR